MSLPSYRIANRGNPRQADRRLLDRLKATYQEELMPEPLQVLGHVTPAELSILLGPDTTLRARLEADGYMAYSAPSVAANLIDIEAWCHEQCGHCWERALIVMPFERPHGGGYVVLTECLECGHQEAV